MFSFGTTWWSLEWPSPTTYRLGVDFMIDPHDCALQATLRQQHRSLTPQQTSPQENWLGQSPGRAEQPLNWGKYDTSPQQHVLLPARGQMMLLSCALGLRGPYLISNNTQILISSLVRCEPWSKVPVKSIYSLCDSLETNTVDPTFLAFISVGAQGLVSFICSAASYFWDV